MATLNELHHTHNPFEEILAGQRREYREFCEDIIRKIIKNPSLKVKCNPVDGSTA